MAISDKLTYLNETKSQLKDMINYGLDEENKITNSTTFRNYVTSIFNAFLEALRTPDTLFTNLPKVSGTGANITLNDTANAPMRITLGASELSQAGTPTPDTPIPINVVSGDNTIEVVGKNLLDLSKCTFDNCILNDDGSIQSNIRNGYYCVINLTYLNDYIMQNKGKQLTFSINKVIDNKRISITIFGTRTSGQTYVELQSAFGERYITGTIPNDFETITKVTLRFNRASTTFTDTETIVRDLMLKQSLSPSKYEPYQSQSYTISLGDTELCKIGDYQDYIYKENGNWYLYKAIGKVVLYGSESWSYQSQFPRFNASYQGEIITTGFNNLYCTHYRTGLDTANNNNCVAFWTNGTSRQIIIHDERFTTKEQFNTWLSSNNVLCYGVLYTPTTTQITDTTLLSQLEALASATAYLGQTNISQINDDLAFNISASAIEELN